MAKDDIRNADKRYSRGKKRQSGRLEVSRRPGL
jgi:hypothetical protein